MNRFPKLPHQSAGCGIECCGYIATEEVNSPRGSTALRCNECGVVVGTISTGILRDLVNLSLATEMDRFMPDAEHINALPGPLRRYIQGAPADRLKHSVGTLTNPVTSWVIIADPYLPFSLLRHAAANFL
jgi:hypothetical protein